MNTVHIEITLDLLTGRYTVEVFQLDETRLGHTEVKTRADISSVQDALQAAGEMIEPDRLLKAVFTVCPVKGCHCTTYCTAPVVMGKQMPCRDLDKAAGFRTKGNV